MENKEKKCSLSEHKDINCISYCQKCNIYMCTKCQNHHSEILKTHQLINIDKDINIIFTGICKEENHQNNLDFFCKTHNILCCAACIAKIKSKSYGQHANCEILSIGDIKNEKKSRLKQNIEILENLSDSLQKSLNEIDKIAEIINENKEKIKIKIQKIFTKLRSTLNDREDELLLEIDNKFTDLFFNEDMYKKWKKLPYEIKFFLEKGKEVDKR